jgi:hypothetical protein
MTTKSRRCWRGNFFRTRFTENRMGQELTTFQSPWNLVKGEIVFWTEVLKMLHWNTNVIEKTGRKNSLSAGITTSRFSSVQHTFWKWPFYKTSSLANQEASGTASDLWMTIIDLKNKKFLFLEPQKSQITWQWKTC